MLPWSQVSISGFLQESEFIKVLNSIGVEVLEGSLKNVDLEHERLSKSIDSDITAVIPGTYKVRYQGRKFAISYFYEERSTLDTSTFVFEKGYNKVKFETSRTYISAITTEITIDLLRKLALHFDAYLDERYKASEDRCFRKVSQL